MSEEETLGTVGGGRFRPLSMRLKVVGVGAVYFGCFFTLFIGSVAIVSEQPGGTSGNQTGGSTGLHIRSIVVDLNVADRATAFKLQERGLGNGTVLKGMLMGETLLFFDLADGSFMKLADADSGRWNLTHIQGDTVKVAGIPVLYEEFAIEEHKAIFSERPGSLYALEPLRFAFVVENGLGEVHEYNYRVSLGSGSSLINGSVTVANGSAGSVVVVIDDTPPAGTKAQIRVELDTGEAIEFPVFRDSWIFAGQLNPEEGFLEKVWSKSYGTDARDYLTSIIKEGSGCAISGSIETVESYTLVGSDVFLLVLDGDGNRVRETIVPGTGLERAGGLTRAEGGNYLISGSWLRSVADKPEPLNPEYYYYFYLAEVGTDVMWEKTWGENQSNEVPFIISSEDGGYILVGGTGEWTSSTQDIYVAKVDSSGNLVWERTHGGSEFERPECTSGTSDGGLVIAGMSDSFGEGILPRDLYILKIDGNGEKVWETAIDLGMTIAGTGFERSGWDWPAAIIEGHTGGYLVVGRIESVDPVTNLGRGYPFIVKVDANGREVWRRVYQGCGNDGLESVVKTDSGDYIAAGYIDSGSGRELYFMAFDDDGNRIWETTYSEEGIAYANEAYPYMLMLRTDEGDLVVVAETGSFYSADFQVLKLRVA